MSSTASPWPPRIAALLLSAAAAGSVAYWALHWRVASEAPLPTTMGTLSPTEVDTAAVARALGGKDASAPPSAGAPVAVEVERARFVLLGVVADASAQGRALVAVDGKPAKPVNVDAELVDGWTLQRVEARRVVLGRNGAELELQLPPLPQPVSMNKKAP